MTEIAINEIERYINDRMVGIDNDLESGDKYAHDPIYARFWEGRQISDRRHKESLVHIMEIIKEAKR